jgi:small-conductance mechanosensitive channel
MIHRLRRARAWCRRGRPSERVLMSETPAIAPSEAKDVAARPLDHENGATPEAQGFLALIFALVSLALLLLAPGETRPAPAAKGWWMAPATWPLFTLLVVFAAAAWQVRLWLKAAAGRDRHAYLKASLGAFHGMRPALEYSAYFCAYLAALGIFGFALSSLVFLQFVTWRAGLSGWRWRLGCFAFVATVVAAFRVGIELWFPLAPIYEALFPEWFVQSVAIYL